jgi:hypothetical protein
MAATTILYLTDSALDPGIADPCRRYLVAAAGDAPIVSVSQEPLDFGSNVCVGPIGRGLSSIARQVLAGLDVIDTEFVAIAEHDCLYTAEHFSWTPPDRTRFHYNQNCWLLQLHNPNHPELDGMFSFLHRVIQSQIICGTEALRRATIDRLQIVSMIERRSWNRCVKEIGLNIASSLMSRFQYAELLPIWPTVERYCECQAAYFRTRQPNIDIRHGGNFSCARRGNKRCYTLAPWGTMADLGLKVTHGV